MIRTDATNNRANATPATAAARGVVSPLGARSFGGSCGSVNRDVISRPPRSCRVALLPAAEATTPRRRATASCTTSPALAPSRSISTFTPSITSASAVFVVWPQADRGADVGRGRDGGHRNRHSHRRAGLRLEGEDAGDACREGDDDDHQAVARDCLHRRYGELVAARELTGDAQERRGDLSRESSECVSDDERQQASSRESPPAPHEADACRRDRRQVGSERHGAHDEDRVLGHDAECGDDAGDGHEHRVLRAEAGVRPRLVDDRAPDERLVLRGEPRALAGLDRGHRLGLQHVDLFREDSRIDQPAHDVVGHRRSELGGYQRLRAVERRSDDHHMPGALHRLQQAADLLRPLLLDEHTHLQHVERSLLRVEHRDRAPFGDGFARCGSLLEHVADLLRGSGHANRLDAETGGAQSRLGICSWSCPRRRER